MKKFVLITFCCLLIQSVFGQYQIGIIPRESPDKMIYQKIGYTEIKIAYGSPRVKNRQIWGELVPYNKVWRAGANSATTIEINAAINIGGQSLDSGKYTFFIIPKENDKWTVVFNKVAKQWGAFRYDSAEDALRFEVRPRITKYKNEDLIYTINQTGFKYGSIKFNWDFMELEVPFETNYLNEFKQEIESRAAKQPDYIKWIPYLQGAEHLTQIKDSIGLAKKWIIQAESIMNTTTEWNKQFYPRTYVEGHLYWIKAKVLALENDYSAALECVDKLKSMKEATYYKKKNEKEGIDIYYSLWKEL